MFTSLRLEQQKQPLEISQPARGPSNESRAPVRWRPAIFLSVCRQSLSAWIDDNIPSMGAAIAFYTVFSIAPLLLIVIAVTGLLFNHSSAQQRILSEISALLGPAGAQAVQGMLVSVADSRRGGLAATIGSVALLIGATSVFAELQSALNRIWRVPRVKRLGGMWSLLRTRLLSFGMILGVGFLSLVSLLLSAGLTALGTWWSPIFGVWQLALRITNLLFSFVVVTLMFAMIYKFLPRASISWSDVWTGSLATALLFEFGKELIGLYLGTSGITSAFGAAGSLAVLLLWVYYSAQIFLLGAEFTWVFAHEVGSRRGQERASQT